MRTFELRQLWDRTSREFYLGFGAGIVCTAILAAALGSQQLSTSPKSASSPQTSSASQTNVPVHTNTADPADLPARLDAAKQQGIEIGKQLAAASAQQGANQVWVYIPAGSSLTDVANLCMAAGVCEDGNTLIGQAQQTGLLIRSGSFALPLKGDPQQILKILSSK